VIGLAETPGAIIRAEVYMTLLTTRKSLSIGEYELDDRVKGIPVAPNLSFVANCKTKVEYCARIFRFR